MTRPTGPGVGVRGVREDLFANYFQLIIKPNLVLYRYSIAVSPELKATRLKQIIQNALLLQQFDALRPGIATDFSAFLVTNQRLSPSHEYVSVPMATGLSPQELIEAKKYAVRFDFLDESSPSTVATQNHTADHESLPFVQDLDILLGHYRKFSNRVHSVGKRKAFSITPPARQVDLGGAFKVLQGCFSSVRFNGQNFLVNINVSNSPFWKSSSLLDVVRLLQNDRDIDNSKIPAFLRGLRVQLTYFEDRTVIRSISGYASHRDGIGCMLHPPRVPNRLGPGAQEVQFWRQNTSEKIKNQEKDNKERVTPHPDPCSCNGEYVSVAKHFESNVTCRRDPVALTNVE